MAEIVAALSLGASIIAFLDYGGQVFAALKYYRDSTRNAPRVVSDLTNRLELWLVTVRQISEDEESGKLEPETQSALKLALDGFTENILFLREYLLGMKPTKKQKWWRRTRKALSIAHYEKELLRVQGTLLGYESTLNLHYITRRPGPHAVAGISATSELWYDVPPLQIVKFVGRQNVLEDIKLSFSRTSANGDRIKLTSIVGLGGQGKSQLALRYCQSVRSSRSVFWIDATSMPVAISNFNRMISMITSSKITAATPGEIKDLVARALKTLKTPFLIVIDNLDQPQHFEHILAILPHGLEGHVIITSRHRDARRLGLAVELGSMSIDEGVDLLLSHTGLENSSANQKIARPIIEMLGGLPLAIDQASAYIVSRSLPLSQFIPQFNDRKRAILEYIPRVSAYRRFDNEDSSAQLSVFTTWELSANELSHPTSTSASSLHLLTLSAFLHSTSVSSQLFKTYYDTFKSDRPLWMLDFTNSGLWDHYKFQDHVAHLFGVSLVQSIDISAKETKFSLHPLVKEWLCLRLQDTATKDFINESLLVVEKAALALVADAKVPDADDLRAIVGHIDSCCASLMAYKPEPSGIIDLTVYPSFCGAVPVFGEVYWFADQLGASERLFRTALNSTQDSDSVYELNHRLGICLYRQKKFAEAETCLLAAMPSDEQTALPLNLKNLEIMMYLALVYLAQGRFHDAMEILPRVKAKREEILGANDKDTAQILEVLGIAYQHVNDLNTAEKLFREAISGFEPTLGKDHLWTLATYHSFANSFWLMGNLEQAKILYERALEGYEQFMGPSHSTTLTVVTHLGRLFHDQKNFEAAQSYYNRASIGWDLIYGPNHPHTLETQRCQGRLQFDLGHLEEAERILRGTLDSVMENARWGAAVLATVVDLVDVSIARQLWDEAESRVALGVEQAEHQIQEPNCATLYSRLAVQQVLVANKSVNASEQGHSTAIESDQRLIRRMAAAKEKTPVAVVLNLLLTPALMCIVQ